MDRREFLAASALGLGVVPFAGSPSFAQEPEQVLYNGIRLPKPWPPRTDKLTLEPMPVPYLKSPPEVIPIDIGRQLFVDDFLIAETTLQRTCHKAEYHAATPVLKPDQKWEQTKDPCAMVFSDGVWYDPADKLFKMWYMGGITRSTCYAVSQDGVRWEKPMLDVVKDTNIVHPGFRDSTTVWLDHEEKDSKRRFKLFRSIRHQKSWALSIHFSPDGIHWTEPGIVSGTAGDRTTAFYNPFRKVWVYSLRSAPLTRSREYCEHADLVAGSKWQEG